MKASSMSIAGMHGIEIPDNIQIDSEFDLAIRVKVYAVRRDLLDVTSFGDEPGTTVELGGLHLDLMAIAGRQM